MSTDPVQSALDALSCAEAVNWDALEARAPDADARATLAALREIAAIAEAHAKPLARPLLPFSWGPLDVRALLARGSQGDVYRAWDATLEREVALKLVRDELDTRSSPTRAINEGRLLARVRHPNVVTVHGADHVQWQSGIWMELIEGSTLRDIVTRSGAMTWAEAVRIGCQVCDGLAAIHAAGLLHRDIKAQNVIRDQSGRCILMDLGAGGEASVQTSRLEGTPLYLAPEILLEGAAASHASDIYAVGALLFFLLTGRYPVEGQSLEQLRAAHRLVRRPRIQGEPSIPPAVAEVIDRAIAPDPEDRFDSAAALGYALASATSEGAERRSWRPFVGTSMLLATVAGLVWAAVTPDRIVRHDRVTLGTHTRLSSDAGLEIDPDLAPGGGWVVYSAGQPGYMRIFLRELETGRTLSLTGGNLGDERRPRWSPDASRILFLADGRLCIADPAAVGAAPMVLAPTGVRSAVWRSDARTVLFVAGRELSEANVVDGTTRVIGAFDAEATELALSPDGLRLAYVSGNPDFNIGTTQFANVGPRVVRLTAVSLDSPPLTVSDPRRTGASPVWTPDGQSLLFLYDADGRRDVYLAEVREEGRATPVLRRITNGLDAVSISLSQSGTTLAYSTLTRRSNVWSVELRAQGRAHLADAVPLTAGSYGIEDPAVSPDGRTLYFASDRNGNSDIYKIRIGSITGEQQLTRDMSDEFVNGVSPDGRELAFHAFRKGRREVFVMPTGGGVPHFVAPGLAADWSPDGSALLIAERVVLERIGTTHRVFQRRDGDWILDRSLGEQKCTQLKWTPDGEGFIGLCGGELVRRDRNGLIDRVLYARDELADLELLAFAVAGETIYIKGHDRQGSASFWAGDLSGGTPRRLLTIDDPTRRSHRAGFQALARTLYLILEERHGDLWAVTLDGV